jgi:hypothetical protein
MNGDGLAITEASADELDQIVQTAGAVHMANRKVFRVCGPKWRGWVLAGVVVWKEDDGEYSDPSALLE